MTTHPVGSGDHPAGAQVRDAERLKFFTDAVVAIALTLLILPLMEGVAEADHDVTVGEFTSEHADQLFSFLLSFVVIATFWMAHHRLYEHVRGFNTTRR